MGRKQNGELIKTSQEVQVYTTKAYAHMKDVAYNKDRLEFINWNGWNKDEQ